MIFRYITLVIKGMAMGAADVVPGVSGGTIAFITGIYDELITSLKSIDFDAVKLLARLKIADFWKHINGNFLVSVFSGILISIFSLAKLIKWLLENEPVLVWSFFFGLILASSVILARKISRWTITSALSLITGVVVMYIITTISPANSTEAWWFIFLSGALAICAMILPGISGAFILLIIGKYHFILTAVSDINIGVILLFGTGVITGLILFSRLLSWLLASYRHQAVAVLTGFIAGSLNKVWPWKESADGIMESNILPAAFYNANPGEPGLILALLTMLAGVMLVIFIELVSNRK